METRGNNGNSIVLLAKNFKKMNKKEKEWKNNFKSHSKYKHTKQGNFIKIFKGSIVILNDKRDMYNF